MGNNMFQKTVREDVWIKALLNGTSGSGKTMSALIMAEAIAEKSGSRVAFISTEGSRTKYYADKYDYDSMELVEHSPEAYMNAIEGAIDSGYKVVIIDSMSHEWKWLNEVHDKMPGNSFTNWGKLKPRHKSFMDKILYSPIHIICCARGKTEWTLEDKNGKQVPKKVGMGSEQDKQINYEFTVSLNLEADTHIASVDKDNTGLFDGKYEVIQKKHGYALYEWANSGEVPASSPVVTNNTSNSVDTEDELKSVKAEIVAKCKELGGSKNTDLMNKLKEFVPSGNPNAIKSLDKAKECLDAINTL